MRNIRGSGLWTGSVLLWMWFWSPGRTSEVDKLGKQVSRQRKKLHRRQGVCAAFYTYILLIHNFDNCSNDGNDEQEAEECTEAHADIHEIVARLFIHVKLRVFRIAHVVTPYIDIHICMPSIPNFVES